MKKEELVSIIVPVYNVEKYIEKCIKSIIQQTYTNIEIIIVNDGSKDNSQKIVEEIANKDSRIRIINKANGGVSSARIEGLKKATGKFIAFVDSDDYLEKDYIEYFYDLINRYDGIDIAVNYNKYNIHTPSQVKNEKVEILNSEIVMEYIYTSKINEAVWNKMYRKSFLDNNKISFDKKIWYGEGMLFNIRCLQYTEKVVIGNKRVYHQTYNPSSAMRNFNLESNLCGIKSLNLQRECWKKEYKNVLDAWKFHKWCFNMSILKGIIKSNSKKKYNKEYKECKSELKRGWKYLLKVRISFPRRCFYTISCIFPVLSARMFLFNEKRNAKKYTAINK